LAPCSPITQASASTTLDLPDPFGPTTQVIPGSRLSVDADANDLKPRSVSVFRCTVPRLAARSRPDADLDGLPGPSTPRSTDRHRPSTGKPLTPDRTPGRLAPMTTARFDRRLTVRDQIRERYLEVPFDVPATASSIEVR